MEHNVLSNESRVMQLLEAKSAGLTEREISSELGIEINALRETMQRLKDAEAAEGRKIGNAVMWYPLAKQVKKVLIVEDDPNINKLMKLSIGQGYETKEVFDGSDAVKVMPDFKPDLVLLDLMLPGLNGLEVCQTIKNNPQTRETIVIIISAADAAKNRFAGLKCGADFYIKKPFNPKDLRALVSIFLKKKGVRFDPLVDLPDANRIALEVEAGLKEGEQFEVSNLRIENLLEFEIKFGKHDAKSMTRLVSQILQDKAREWKSQHGFIGYLGDGEFVVGGGKNETNLIVEEVAGEFERVLPFIYQDQSTKQKQALNLDLAEMFDAPEHVPKRIRIAYTPIPIERLLSKRAEVLQEKGMPAGVGGVDASAYSYSDLKKMLGSSSVDVAITRDAGGVKFSVSKEKK